MTNNIKPIVQTALNHQLSIDMRYEPSDIKKVTGERRLHCTILYCARFGVVSPTFLSWLYGISHSLCLEHLNRLVRLQLLKVFPTIRVPGGRVYILTLSGAKFAEELLGQHVPFRSSSNPEFQVNQNSLMHDVILQFALSIGIQHIDSHGKYSPLWMGFVTEKEFKRLFPSSAIRNVDGLISEADGTLCAVELEHSFKPIQLRKNILLRYLDALRMGLYEKVFFISQSERILNDIKRVNAVAMDNLQSTSDKKSNNLLLSSQDRKLLEKRLIYRTKFCGQITDLFYR